MYYYPETVPENRKIRNIGLCEAMVNFTRTFTTDNPCEVVHTQKTKQAFLEPEPGIWMILVGNGERERERELGRSTLYDTTIDCHSTHIRNYPSIRESDRIS